LAIAPENITEFRRGLSTALADCETAAEKTITIDALVELPQVSTGLLNTIRRLAPFGSGNPPVILGCKGLRVLEDSVFGKTGAHKRLVVADEAGRPQEVIWWGGANEPVPPSRFDLAFKISPDDYRHDNAVQMEWLDAREWEPVPVSAPPKFFDWRAIPNPQSQIATLANPLIWAEGTAIPNLTVHPRHKLYRTDTLVIWTAPPGQDILQQTLATVRPRQIFLVGQSSPLDIFPAFIQQLVGLVKYALTHQAGEIDLTGLAAALSHRVTTTRLGLNWLAAQGKLAITIDGDELLVLRPAQAPSTGAANMLEESLKSALAETAAYRRFFKKAGLSSLQVIA
jgi:single-stranded-DNA-specific exonuclease